MTLSREGGHGIATSIFFIALGAALAWRLEASPLLNVIGFLLFSLGLISGLVRLVGFATVSRSGAASAERLARVQAERSPHGGG